MTCIKRPELEASQIITMFPMDECMDCECQKYEDGMYTCEQFLHDDEEE